MLHISKWKVIVIVIIVVFSLHTTILNFLYHENKESYPPKINLGLDLKGGSHLLLEIEF